MCIRRSPLQYPKTDRRKPDAASHACRWRSFYQRNSEQVKWFCTRQDISGWTSLQQELIMKYNAQQSRKEGIMAKNKQALEASTSRRSFLQKGVVIGGAGTIGAGLLSAGL